MIRESLTSYPANEQFAFATFEAPPALAEKDQMACGIFMERMNRNELIVSNKNLINQNRLCEFMRILKQSRVEFKDLEDAKSFFRRVGVDTRTNGIYEMYLEQDELFCNYCFQISTAPDAPFCLRIKAYTKNH